MKFLGALLVVGFLPLAGCAAMQGVGAGGPDIEELPQNYNIFFDVDSATLDDAAEQILAQVAADAQQFGPQSIRIAGFSAPGPGESAANIGEQRIAAVENALASSGVDRALFMRMELTADPSLPELATRRVEIRFELP